MRMGMLVFWLTWSVLMGMTMLAGLRDPNILDFAVERDLFGFV